MKHVMGAVTPLAGVGVSLFSHIETWLRITSLILGCLVGGLTLYNIIRDSKKRNRKK